MNTIKFTPASNERTETHNIEVYDIKEKIFNTKKYRVYGNASLTIYITNKCNANCPFCMNKYEDNYLYSKEINSDKEYIERLDYVLNQLKDLNPAIAITGGEPTKSSKLVPTLQLIKRYGYRYKSFSTNGSGLLDLVDNKPILQHMLENNVVQNINISRMHSDQRVNSKLMMTPYAISNEDVQRIATFCNTNGMGVRMGCTLQKGGVTNLKEILDYRDFYKNLGVETTLFRELVNIKKSAPNYDNYMNKFVDISEIVKELRKNQKFKHIRDMEGLYYSVQVFAYEDSIVKCYTEKDYDNDIIRDFVFYADGRLMDTDWNNRSKVLLNY